MSITWVLYIVELINNLECVLTGVFMIAGIFALLSVIAWFVTLDSYCDEWHAKINATYSRLFKKWWVAGLLIIALIATPSKQTMYLMLGANYLSQSSLPGKVNQALEMKLDDVIRELKHDSNTRHDAHGEHN